MMLPKLTNKIIDFCKSQNISPDILIQKDSSLIEIISSFNATICYATGHVSVEEIIDLSKEKIDILLSPNAMVAYYSGIKASQLKDQQLEDIELLISNIAIEAYKNNFINIEMLSKQSYQDKILTLYKFCTTLYIDSQIEDLESLNLSVDNIDKIKLLISDEATHSYRNNTIQLNELVNCNIEQIEEKIELAGEQFLSNPEDW